MGLVQKFLVSMGIMADGVENASLCLTDVLMDYAEKTDPSRKKELLIEIVGIVRNNPDLAGQAITGLKIFDPSETAAAIKDIEYIKDNTIQGVAAKIRAADNAVNSINPV